MWKKISSAKLIFVMWSFCNLLWMTSLFWVIARKDRQKLLKLRECKSVVNDQSVYIKGALHVFLDLLPITEYC